MPDSLEAVFVLLSDLHFGDDLLLETDGPLPSVPWWLRALDYDVKRYFDTRCAAHDIAILKLLPPYLKSLLMGLRHEGYKGTDNDFDLYLLLGDLATLPTGKSYNFLREYLTRRRYVTGDSELQHKCVALGISRERLLIIPGNHDKLLLTSLHFYHSQMLRPLGIAEEPEPQSCFLRLHTVRGRRFLFLLVDASRYAAENNCIDFSCRDHLASGEISAGLRKAILTKLRSLKSGQAVDGIDPKDYPSATKILVVHHGVDISKVAGLGQHLQNFFLPHECKGLDSLVEELGDELHMVVHGHLHKPKLYSQGKVPVVAATTTTQRGNEENGLFLLKFFASGDIRAEHHQWLKTGFLPDSRSEFNQPVRRASSVP